MVKEIKVTLSDAEYAALEYVTYSAEDWVDNAAHERCRKAIDEIVALYTTRALSEGVQIPLTRDEIVLDAYDRGWVVSGKELTDASEDDPAGLKIRAKV